MLYFFFPIYFMHLFHKILGAKANIVDPDRTAPDLGLHRPLCIRLVVKRYSRFDSRWDWQNSFVEIDHKIFSTVILSLPLIQEGEFSVSGKRMCTNTG